MNILLTLNCSLNCAYCFARSRRTAPGRREMSLVELEQVLQALDPARETVRLLGGDPTLHSQYVEALALLKERVFRVAVFTNGLQASLHETAPTLPDEVLLNLNDWQTYTANQRAAIQANLIALGSLVGLGYTIARPDFDLSWHRQLIKTHGLRPVLRVGLAHPVVGGDNLFLPDLNLPDAHRSVARWAGRLADDGIRLALDCGFMRCHFSEADLEGLVRAGTRLDFGCRPAWDVGPGLQVWRCLAFSNAPGKPWNPDRPTPVGREETVGLPLACASCPDPLRGWCQGGCLARRIQNESFSPSKDGASGILENVGRVRL